MLRIFSWRRAHVIVESRLRQIQVRAIFHPSRRDRHGVMERKTLSHNFVLNVNMKLILASLIASAAAFAPVSQKAASTTSLNAFEGELGTFSLR
jgi:hypothetical protein